MACAVAALKAEAITIIEEAQAIKKSYPDFYEHLQRAGCYDVSLTQLKIIIHMNSVLDEYSGYTFLVNRMANRVGIDIDGCPAGLSLTVEDFYQILKEEKAAQKGTTPRKEEDIPISKVVLFNGKTTGAPITILFENKNTPQRGL